MDYQELLDKYNLLQFENKRLKEEYRRLRIKLGESPPPMTGNDPDTRPDPDHVEGPQPSSIIPASSTVTFTSNVTSKIELFKSLFKGREDVYAIRWENSTSGKSGYTPVCLNRRKPALCGKPRIPCSKCNHRNYAALNEEVIKGHLLGKSVVGIYPLLKDETCWFLAMDFDDDGWQGDVAMVRMVCNDFQIPIAVERSRSGSGGHAWFSFEQPVAASLARKFGSTLLTTAMNQRHEIRFQTYDRLFPSQETMPKASAFTYVQILKTTDARYVYGLTATPTRKDGHHPILHMHLGAIRYRDDARKQAGKRPFEHHVIPRFTSLQRPTDQKDDEISIQQWYSRICEDEFRNDQIVEDVLQCYRDGRNSVVLSLRTAHVDRLAAIIRREVPDVITLTGALGARGSKEALNRIRETRHSQNLIIVATGPFIGEGFDEPRLDTLFLAMPISWKGTLQQYAGRLHRLVDLRKEVRIYDYVDVHVQMLEKMYQKRLKGYASMGYTTKGENLSSSHLEIIFDQDNFLPVFRNDILCAQKEILIVSPFLRQRRTAKMIEDLMPAVTKKVAVNVITRPSTDFNPRDQAPFKTALDLFDGTSIKVAHQSNTHQKFAVMDRKIVWYGSVNLLSFGSARESLMRIESGNIARELEKTIELIQTACPKFW